MKERQLSIKIKPTTYKKISKLKLYLEDKHKSHTIPRSTILDYCVNSFIKALKEENDKSKEEGG